MLWPASFDYISAPPGAAFRQKKTPSLAILGSTGSIGRKALEIVEKSNGLLRVSALACGSNCELLAQQAARFRPAHLACLDESAAARLAALLPPDCKAEIDYGPRAFARLASLPEIDLLLSCQVGAAGLPATLAAALAGKVIALANKESLVLAGSLLRKICAQSGASILPVDSEHFALFQCLAGRENAASLILTASGGPFLGRSNQEMRNITPAEALRHPTWNMGRKISIDSATMMNKGFELIEAMHIYGAPPERIEILVHPQSVIHSLVRFADGALLAQLATPDMRLPIGGCLLWPRGDCESFIKALDLAQSGTLSFARPDLEAFPCLGLARQAASFIPSQKWLQSGFNPACVALNSANDKAVELFLAGRLGFTRIAEAVALALEAVFTNCPAPAEGASQNGEIPAQALALARIPLALEALARKIVEDFARA